MTSQPFFIWLHEDYQRHTGELLHFIKDVLVELPERSNKYEDGRLVAKMREADIGFRIGIFFEGKLIGLTTEIIRNPIRYEPELSEYNTQKYVKVGGYLVPIKALELFKESAAEISGEKIVNFTLNTRRKDVGYEEAIRQGFTRVTIGTYNFAVAKVRRSVSTIGLRIIGSKYCPIDLTIKEGNKNE